MTYEEWYKKYVKDNPKARGQEKAIQNKASDQAQYQKYKKLGIGWCTCIIYRVPETKIPGA